MAGRFASLSAAALASAGAASFGLWRLLRAPLPTTRGSVEVEGIEAAVTIARDRFGVPRIEARTDADLCFGQGWCLGQDRGWQLEFYRRVGRGRLSEFAGPETLRLDRLMRTFGFARRCEQELELIDPRMRELLAAYAAGINAAVAAATAPPFEMQVLRLAPEPWTPADSLLIGKLLALGFSTNMESELFRSDLVARVGPQKAAKLEPRYPAGNPVAVTPGSGWSGDGEEIARQMAELRARMGMSPDPAGSNNWAVSGERSVTGAPLLAGDPHISSTMPGPWYAVELSTPEIELRGGALPGIPGAVMGQARHVAWSFTNAMADVQDLFVERIREGENGTGPEYEFEGRWLPVDVRREEIRVRGRPDDVLEVRETHHGPIVNGPLGARVSEPLALAWTALREPFMLRLLSVELARCRNGRELADGLGDFVVPNMNLVWADDSGSIGYKLIGRLPRRRGGCPDVPKPGWTGEYEWDGYVPYDELPELVDPAEGAIVTANNRIAPADYPHHITSDYFEGYRAARIEQLLAEEERHSLTTFERIQADVYSIPGEETVHRLARLRPTDQRLVRTIERLKSWDCRLDAGTVAGTIYQAFTHHFARAVSEAAIGEREDAERWRSRGQLGFTLMIATPWRFHARLLELWEEGDRELIGGRDWDELALDSLSEALEDLTARYGSDPSGWTWGRVHGVRFAHPLADGDGPVARFFERLLARRLPAGGAQETVNTIGHVSYAGEFTGVWGPSYRLLADLGDPDRSRWQHMTGQSGHPGSAHYDDLLDDWLRVRSNPVAQPAVETLTLTPR